MKKKNTKKKIEIKISENPKNDPAIFEEVAPDPRIRGGMMMGDTEDEVKLCQEMRAIFRSGINDAIKGEAREYTRSCIELGEKPMGVTSMEWQAIEPHLKAAQEMKQRRKDEKNDHWALLLTYNPKPGLQTYAHVRDMRDGICRMKMFKEATVATALEQRGTTDETMGDGAHLHILMDTHRIRKSQWEQRLGQFFTKYGLFDKEKVGKARFDESIDLVWYHKYEQGEEVIPKKMKYLLGKKCEDKQLKQHYDEKWREFNKSRIEFS